MKRLIYSSLSIFLIPFLGACGGKAESEDVRTPGIQAEIEVRTRGNGQSRVVAVLTVGDGGLFPTMLDLTGDDRMRASDGRTTKTLEKDFDLLGDIQYEASFDGDDTGTEFVVMLERSGDTSAPDSRVRLPGPFNLISPANNASFTLDEQFDVLWEGDFNSDAMRLITATRCPSVSGGTLLTGDLITVEDNGSYVLTGREAIGGFEEEAEAGATCEIELTLIRVRSGTLDPNYAEGGYIEGQQIRSVDIRVINR